MRRLHVGGGKSGGNGTCVVAVVGGKAEGVVVVGSDVVAVEEWGAETVDRAVVVAVVVDEGRCSWVDDDVAKAVALEICPVVEVEAYQNDFLPVPDLRLDLRP